MQSHRGTKQPDVLEELPEVQSVCWGCGAEKTKLERQLGADHRITKGFEFHAKKLRPFLSAIGSY